VSSVGFILLPYQNTRNTTSQSSQSSVPDRMPRKHTPQIVDPSASENPCSQAFGLPLIKPLHHRRERYNLFFLLNLIPRSSSSVSGSELFHSTSLPPPLEQTPRAAWQSKNVRYPIHFPQLVYIPEKRKQRESSSLAKAYSLICCS
jgi:hypothetical protein